MARPALDQAELLEHRRDAVARLLQPHRRLGEAERPADVEAAYRLRSRRCGGPRCRRGPPPLGEALEATARIAQAAAPFGERGTLWTGVEPAPAAHPTDLPAGASGSCGTCAWRYEQRGTSRCRQAQAKVDPSWPGCARHEAALDCQTWGLRRSSPACLAWPYWWRGRETARPGDAGDHRPGRGAARSSPSQHPDGPVWPPLHAGGALELRLSHYLDHQYNRQPHEALTGQTPLDRFESDTRALRFPASDAELTDRFVVTETRKVSADNVISYASTDYEVPRGHAGTEITVGRHLLSGALSVVHDGKLVTLAPVDLARNAVSRRAVPPAPAPDDDEGAPRTAAQIAFARDFASVVGPDGGFPHTPTRSSTTKGNSR